MWVAAALDRLHQYPSTLPPPTPYTPSHPTPPLIPHPNPTPPHPLYPTPPHLTPHPTLPPSACLPACLQLRLCQSLASLPQDQFELALALVLRDHPGLVPNDDVALDIDALDALTLRQLLVSRG